MTSELESLKQENARLMARIAELEHVVGESTRREAENVELKAEVAKLRHDFEELKQQTQVITNVQDTSSIVNISPNNFDSGSKSLEDKEVDEFLELEHKKSVCNEIIVRNRKKKIQKIIYSKVI